MERRWNWNVMEIIQILVGIVGIVGLSSVIVSPVEIARMIKMNKQMEKYYKTGGIVAKEIINEKDERPEKAVIKAAKEKFGKELERAKTETVPKEDLIKAFEADLKRNELAEKLRVSVVTVNNWCHKYFGKSYKNEKQAFRSRKIRIEHFQPKTVEMPVNFDERIQGGNIKDPRDIVDEEGNLLKLTSENIESIINLYKNAPLCPILASEVSGKDWRGYIVEPGDLFHTGVTDLPYYNYNPVKRLRRAAASWLNHGDFEQTIQAEHYFKGESKGLIYLKVCFATSEEDLYLTNDGGLIISEKASAAMAYNFLVRDYITEKVVRKTEIGESRAELEEVVKKYPSDRKIQAGEELTPKIVFTADGYLINHKIRGRKNFTFEFEILKRGQIGVGDKLLGLTSLKGIVCEVRNHMPNDSDIMINPNQVYGKKETRKCGAALKEINKTGRLAVFYQAQQLASSRFSKKPVSISSTVYPIIALYGSKELQTEILPNQELADLFYMLDLVLDNKGEIKSVNRQAKPKEGGKLYLFNHYLWDIDFVKEKIWLPNWLPKKSLQSRKSGIKQLQKTRLFETIDRLGKINDDEERSLVLFSTFKKEAIIQLIRSVTSKTKKGRNNFVAVAKIGKTYEIEFTQHDMSLLKIKSGQKVLLRREPVVSKYHVQEFIATKTKDRFQQNNTVKLVPEAIRLMAGDIDGDPLILLILSDKNFRVPEKAYKAEKLRLEKELMKDFDISKINTEELYKTDDELLNLAEEEHAKQRKRRHEVPYVGGARKAASIAQDSIKFEKDEIEEYAVYLEEGLKDVMVGKFVSEDDKTKRIAFWKKSGKSDCALKMLWRDFREGQLKGTLLDKLLGKKFLPNDRSGLYKLLISKIERIGK